MKYILILLITIIPIFSFAQDVDTLRISGEEVYTLKNKICAEMGDERIQLFPFVKNGICGVDFKVFGRSVCVSDEDGHGLFADDNDSTFFVKHNSGFNCDGRVFGHFRNSNVRHFAFNKIKFVGISGFGHENVIFLLSESERVRLQKFFRKIYEECETFKAELVLSPFIYDVSDYAEYNLKTYRYHYDMFETDMMNNFNLMIKIGTNTNDVIKSFSIRFFCTNNQFCTRKGDSFIFKFEDGTEVFTNASILFEDCKGDPTANLSNCCKPQLFANKNLKSVVFDFDSINYFELPIDECNGWMIRSFFKSYLDR